MKEKIIKYFLRALLLFVALLFLGFFAKGRVLTAYIKTGIGDCIKIPILCKVPNTTIQTPNLNAECPLELLPYGLNKISVCVPKGFTVVNELTRKVYYKKWHAHDKGSTMYLLYEPPGFFPHLYPDVKKAGILDNYQFIRHLMFARLNTINGLTDTFFVVMKSIFTPNIGDQHTAIMAEANIEDKKVFINYNLGEKESYFDCNILTGDGAFFKIYIKDKDARLSLDNVCTIIASVRKMN